MITETIEQQEEEIEITDEQHLAEVMRGIREKIQRQTRNADACESILAKLPRIIRSKAVINEEGMDFFQCSHDDAIEAMRCMGLGRWEKSINASYPERIDYTINSNGILIIIWGAQPPGTCRIVEEEIEVPATKVIKRRLICT